MKVNFLFEYKKYKGAENMALDLTALDYAIKTGEFYVRFYGWKPKCVSLGRNQKEFKPGVPVDVVKRPTGGRALFHDNEITYSITGKIPHGQGVVDTYKTISHILIEGFRKLNIPLELAGKKGGDKKYCMNISSGADISYMGKKFIGSAQYRKEGYFLQHGSILKSFNAPLIEKIFNEPVEKEKIISLNEIAPNLKDDEVIWAIKQAFVKML